MIDPKILTLLRCPLDKKSLEIASEDLLAKLNAAIARSEVYDRSGQKVSKKLDEGLVTADRGRIYPIQAGIPILVADQAIEIREIGEKSG